MSQVISIQNLNKASFLNEMLPHVVDEIEKDFQTMEV